VHETDHVPVYLQSPKTSGYDKHAIRAVRATPALQISAQTVAGSFPRKLNVKLAILQTGPMPTSATDAVNHSHPATN
jgi:hypothetical protein